MFFMLARMLIGVEAVVSFGAVSEMLKPVPEKEGPVSDGSRQPVKATKAKNATIVGRYFIRLNSVCNNKFLFRDMFKFLKNQLYFMKASKILLLAFLSLIFSSVALAQEPSLVGGLVDWVYGLGSWSIFIIVTGGAITFCGILLGRLTRYEKWGKYICYLGLAVIFVGLFVIEMIYIIPMLGSRTSSAALCKEAFTTETGGATGIMQVFVMASCTFTGYVPVNLTSMGIATFVIFGFLAPLIVLTLLFYQFTDFLGSGATRRVMAFIIALIAYRGLLATLFIEFFNYSFAGLGVLAMNYLIMMIVISIFSKMWAGTEKLATLVTTENRLLLARTLREIEDVQAEISSAKKSRLPTKDLEEQLKSLEAERDRLARKVRIFKK
jgi:uncharacterized membrane protein